MRYLHTMIRVSDLEQSLEFFCNLLGFTEIGRVENGKGRYTLCGKLMQAGITINRPPRDGHMAFVRSPDNISIELLQEGAPLPPREPWVSMPNAGTW